MPDETLPILVICSDVPESIRLYLLHLGPADLARALRCNGVFINSALATEAEHADARWLDSLLQDVRAVQSTRNDPDAPRSYVPPFRVAYPDVPVVVTGFLL